MSRRTSRWLAWSLLTLAIALFLTAYALEFATGTSDGFDPFMVALALVFGVVGGLIASRHWANPIGWIFLGASVATGLSVLSGAYASYYVDTRAGPQLLGETVAAYDQVSWIPFILVPATFLLLLVPDGRLPGRRWRWVGRCAAVGMAGSVVAQSMVAGPIPDYPQLVNPFGVDSPAIVPFEVITFVLIAVGVVGSAASLVVRFHRATGEERQQIKWLALAGAVAAITIVVSTTAGYAVLGADASNILIMLSVMGLPVATGVAILRHNLYDIDVVINRALVYGALTASLAGVYLGTVLLLQLALSPFTEGSSLAIAVSTLAVAALFRPARTRIQHQVDRRFFRAKYDAAQTLEAFGAHLRDQVDLTGIGTDLLAVVAETVQPSHVSLWLRTQEVGR